jgi:hypothetical protein
MLCCAAIKARTMFLLGVNSTYNLAADLESRRRQKPGIKALLSLRLPV